LSEEPRAGVDQSEFLALVGGLRPELHRYCARLTGSVMDGEDVVQESLASAFVALKTVEAAPSMRAWLFRIAHNRALDLLRSRALRATEPLEAASETPDPHTVDPLETLMRQEAIRTAVSRFVELPTIQRSVVILKDVLGHSLEDIAALLDTTVNAVKGHLARGRARLKAINAHTSARADDRTPSPQVARFVALFNQRDWEALRALLAQDVKLMQSTHPVRVGAADVGMFFTIYAKMDRVSLSPAWLEGREVVAVFEDRDDPKPSYLMWLDWRENQISFIRDTRYVRYVLADAQLAFDDGALGRVGGV
jgi:RNA polymerase sigma factor (sigma-70 family)